MKLTETELQEHVRLRLETPRGSWLYDPEFGSELWRLHRAKNIREILRDAIRYIHQALKPEIDAGLMDEVTKIEIAEQTQTSLKLRVDVRAGEIKITVFYKGITGLVIPDDVVGC